MRRLIDANKVDAFRDIEYDGKEIKSVEEFEKIPTVLTIPENPTNGDIIKAVFPNAEISILKSKTEKSKVAVTWNYSEIPGYYNLFYEDWWNAPYKEIDNA